jgi:adenylate kinase
VRWRVRALAHAPSGARARLLGAAFGSTRHPRRRKGCLRVVTVLVLLGAPGAGKGTQAKVLESRLRLPHLASGDLLRAAVIAGTQVGREADRYMSRGQLVPDGTMIRIFLDRLERPDAIDGAILDGFPRTRTQAEALDAELAGHGRRVDRALLIEVPVEDLVRRAAGRWICSAAGHVYHEIANPPRTTGVCDIDGSALIQRADDREETVRARMAQQLGALAEVVEHYDEQGILRRVDGRQPIDAVTDALVGALEDVRGVA